MESKNEQTTLVPSKDLNKTSVITTNPQRNSIPTSSNVNTKQELSFVSSRTQTNPAAGDETTFKVPAPRTYGKQKTKSTQNRLPNAQKPINIPQFLYRGPRIPIVPRIPDHLLARRKKLVIPQVLPKPPPPLPPAQKIENLAKRKVELDNTDPDLLYQAILSTDINSCMKPFLLTRIRKQKKKIPNCSNVRLTHMDPLVLYGISLHRYANNMCEMIRVAELAIESNLIPPADAAPQLPKRYRLKQKHTVNGLNYMPKRLTPFARGVGEMPPELSSSVVREILSQSIAATVGLLGFETTHQSVLDILVDVLIEFLKKVSYRLKLAFDDEQRGWMADFPNIAERVLVELGMGGCKGLHDYYQTRIVGYVNLLENHCDDLNKHYQSLLTSKSPPTEDLTLTDVAIKIETKEEIVEIDTPQLQIALNEELELPSLDAGFQLLSSLEAGT